MGRLEMRRAAVEIEIAAGLLCRNGRILLGKRAAHRRSYPGVWDLPGGHVENGETAEQALVRELHEELGVTPVVGSELALLHAPAMGDERGATLRMRVFQIMLWSGEPHNLLPEEHDEIGWFPLDEATQLTLAHPDYPALFQAALEIAQ